MVFIHCYSSQPSIVTSGIQVLPVPSWEARSEWISDAVESKAAVVLNTVTVPYMGSYDELKTLNVVLCQVVRQRIRARSLAFL
jgi:hypothetical protein